MELPSKKLQQIAFNTRPEIEEHMLIVMDKSSPEEHLAQPLQSNNKEFKIAVTFLSGYNGIFIVSESNNKFYFQKILPTQMILFKLLHHQVLKKLKFGTMKSRGLLMINVIIVKMNINSR